MVPGTGIISIYVGEKTYCVLPLHKYLQGRKVTNPHIHFLSWVSVGNWALFYRRRIREVLKAHGMMGCIIPRVCFPSPDPGNDIFESADGYLEMAPSSCKSYEFECWWHSLSTAQNFNASTWAKVLDVMVLIGFLVGNASIMNLL